MNHFHVSTSPVPKMPAVLSMISKELIVKARTLLATLAVALGFTCGVSGAAAAILPAVSITGGATRDFGAGLSLGYEFTMTQDAEVSALGVYDGGSSGLSTDHAVGIFSPTDQVNPITDTTVLATDTNRVGTNPDGYFVYHNITPVTLHAGQTYRIAAYYPANSPDLFIGGFFSTPYVVNALETEVFGYYTEYAGALAYPVLWAYPNYVETVPITGEQIPHGFPWTGPNFLLTVPEPASLSLLSASVMLLARRRRS
jgi:hypothetical protein